MSDQPDIERSPGQHWLRWLARVASAFLFLFWGAFFLEHLIEWFVRPFPAGPPASVWVAQFGHFLILIGYAAGWFQERIGALMLLLGAGVFLGVGDAGVLPLVLGSCLPAFLWFAGGNGRSRRRRTPDDLGKA
jgi:hypothetical protein